MGKQIEKKFMVENCSLKNYVDSFSKDKILRNIPEHIKTGFSKVDKVLGGGIACKGMYVIGANSGLGKSTWCLQIAQEISKSGRPVVYYSLEMPQDRILAKAFSRQLYLDNKGKPIAKYSGNDLFNNERVKDLLDTASKWKQFEKAKAIVEQEVENFFVVTGYESNQLEHMVTAKQICEDTLAFEEEFNREKSEKIVPIVIVDYLQLLASAKDNGGGSDKQKIDESVGYFMKLASKMPVILISSLSRGGYKEQISMEFLKESGNIEYSADCVLGLQLAAFANPLKKAVDLAKEMSQSPRKVELVVLKNRYGKSGEKIKLDFYPDHDYFAESKTNKTEKVTAKSKDTATDETTDSPIRRGAWNGK